jgi:hypothetical protein
LHFLETGGTILNCVFGKGGVLYCCDMGPFDVTGTAMSGRLITVDRGVEGMRPVSRRDRLRICDYENRQGRSHPG